VKKSFILKKNNLRILIIGASPAFGPFNELCGLAYKDYIEVIKEEIAANSGKYDLSIVLSHVGMDKDKEIAMQIEGF
jgi:5'-nucleotidase